MSKKQFEAGSPSPMNPIPTTSNYDMLDVGLHTPEIRESFSAPVSANGEISDHGRFRSASVCGFGGEAARLEETRKRYQRMQNVGLSIEYRLSRLEKEHLRLLSATTAPQSTNDDEHSKGKWTDKDYARFEPDPRISRVSSDDWRDIKRGRFAVPEPSVLTVSSRGRNWTTGRRQVPENYHGVVNDVVEEASSVPAPLVESTSERPYRVAIHGYELHRALEVIIGSSVSLYNNVWIWPFKHFISYEKQIRRRLEEQETLLDIIQMSSTNGVNGPESNGNMDNKPETSSDGAKLRDQLRCLVDFMDEDMKPIFSIQRQIDDGSLQDIAFEHLWQLFRPGDLIFSGTTQKRAYRILHVTGGRAILDIGDQPPIGSRSASQPLRSWERHEDQAITYAHSRNTPFIIDAFYIDFDGENFGPVPRRFVIQEYEGEQPIDTLHAYPAKFDVKVKDTEKELLKRGRKFVKLAGVTHKRYSGLSAREPSVNDQQDEVNGDVVIDFEVAIRNFRKRIPGWDVGLGAGVLEEATRADKREISEVKPCSIKGCTLCKVSDIFDDSRHDIERRSEFLDTTTLIRYHPYAKASLTEDQFVLLPPRVYGYSLLERSWFPLNIDLVDDIKVQPGNGFDNLVLPGDHKHIMQALVKNHTRGSRPTSGKAIKPDFSTDLVRGKGRGLIILLHGVPGVGKTSTAECVAAQTKRPLFPITCGDIGTTASAVEETLESYFDLAHKWGCVLLLDEADVYLAKRERGDLERNSLVSVFLRVLEYYSGILILTTNRVGEFDEAFKSRIHISLYYPPLDRASTIKIWEMNIDRIEKSNDINLDVQADKIIKFAKAHWSDSKRKGTRRWNGRQIKNAFQTAIALAKWDYNDEHFGPDSSEIDRPRLSDKHFEIVSKTSDHFDDYISAIYGIEENDVYGELAERDMLRKDSVQSVATLRRRDQSDRRRRRSRLAIRGASKRQTSDRDESDRSGKSEDSIEELKQKLVQAEAKKSRKKSAGRREDWADREEEPPKRRRKKTEVSPDSSEQTESE